MTINSRIGSTHRVDSRLPILFKYDGKQYTGCAGDSVASALLSNGVTPKNAKVNNHAERDAWAQRQRLLPSLIREHFEPWAQPFGWLSDLPVSEGLCIERSKTGLFQKPAEMSRCVGDWPEPDSAGAEPLWFEREEKCDVLVAGAGPAGLVTARQAAAEGKRVIVADAGTEVGGELLQSQVRIDENPASAWIDQQVQFLRKADNVLFLRSARVHSKLEDGSVAVVQLVSGGDPNRLVRHRLWRVKAAHIAVCTGKQERGLVFADNDRTGIVLASFVGAMLNRYGVSSAHSIAFFTNNDSAYKVACAAAEAGVTVPVIADTRKVAQAYWQQYAQELGITIIGSARVVRMEGRHSLSSITFSGAGAGGDIVKTFECEQLAMSGGWEADADLIKRLGASVEMAADGMSLRPATFPESLTFAGAVADRDALELVRAQGHTVDDPPQSPAQAAWWDETQPAERQWLSVGQGITLKDLRDCKVPAPKTVQQQILLGDQTEQPTGVAETALEKTSAKATAIDGEQTDQHADLGAGATPPEAPVEEKLPAYDFIMPIYQSGLELAVLEDMPASFTAKPKDKRQLKAGRIDDAAWFVAKGRWLLLNDESGEPAAIISIEGTDVPEFFGKLKLSEPEKARCVPATINAFDVVLAKTKANQWQLACNKEQLGELWAKLDDVAQGFAI